MITLCKPDIFSPSFVTYSWGFGPFHPLKIITSPIHLIKDPTKKELKHKQNFFKFNNVQIYGIYFFVCACFYFQIELVLYLITWCIRIQERPMCLIAYHKRLQNLLFYKVFKFYINKYNHYLNKQQAKVQ